MTLKEAKRAHKKDGVAFRYTASQMARADRIDAQEAKRKKALEKEKQRVENKRKRDEKADKERVVRQKMLDEGRISVEDTWGKVTASQPRLNKFFGQKPVAAPAKSNLRTQLDLEEETTLEGQHAEHDEREETDQLKGDDASQEDKPADRSQRAQRPSSEKTSPQPLMSSDQMPSQKPRLTSSLRDVQPRSAPSTQSRHSALKELDPLRFNGQSSGAQRFLRSRQLSQSTSNTPQHSSTISKDDAIVAPESTKQSPLNPSHVSGNTDVFHASCEKLSCTRSNARQNDQENNRGDQVAKPVMCVSDGQQLGQKQGSDRLLDSSLDTRTEEDFTDGLDDETFLMLCSTQALPKETISKRSLSPTNSAAVRAGPEHKDESVAKNTIGSPTKHVEAVSEPLSESFTSVFNEIEDDDLIALAERIESVPNTPNQAWSKASSPQKRTLNLLSVQPLSNSSPSLSSKQACMTAAQNTNARTKTITAEIPSKQDLLPRTVEQTPRVRMQPPRLTSKASEKESAKLQPNMPLPGGNATPKPLPKSSRQVPTKLPAAVPGSNPPRSRPAFLRNEEPVSVPKSKPKPKRRYPWDTHPMDEFVELGPSTQALTLELLEQVEAQMKRNEH